MGYTIARWFFKVLLLCLTLAVIPLAISLIQVLVAFPRNKFPDNLYSTILGWFFLPGASLTGTLSITGVFIFLLILTSTITAMGEVHSGGLALKNYLRYVADKNSDLKPVGFSQQSALISVRVPLDELFIHLHVTTDRPRFDLPSQQLKYLEELRKRTDLTLEQREKEIQALRVVWYSQLGSELFEASPSQNINVEFVMEQLTAKQPGAVILGSPGSGKSTTMRWLAYHMAQAGRLSFWKRELNALLHFLRLPRGRQFTLKDAFSERIALQQIPILIRISDYAKVLSKAESEQQAFQSFLIDYFRRYYPELPKLAERLLVELEKGHCLLLLDGLDEVANDDLRSLVADKIASFVAHYSPESANVRHFNHFIITSRIVGYEGGIFANYAHYTLQDLEDEQIEQFLASWCPAVERHQKTFAQGMKKLTPQQIEQANKDGQEQKERLWEVLRQNPGIKRLAVNPLMLTILALIQRSGKTLPHRRIELYQTVTRTLLDNWNQETGRRVFPADELELAEYMLSCLAFEMHSNDRLLTEAKVKEIAGKAMYDFCRQEPSEQKIKSFIDTLRSSSGLLIETGQGFFAFMHRTFQEYFAVQYLLHKTYEQLKQAVKEYSHKTTWREPLLLLVAYKSMQSSYEDQERASDLIEVILETCDEYDAILQRNLLLAANCVVDCSAWVVRHDLQRRIANRIFDIYGDVLETGRYTALQKEIERIALLWLRGQPQEESDTHPPLLGVWYSALCDANQAVRQEGAVHLLATLALDLPDCPQPVLSILLPPLLQLADIVDIACPPEHIRKQLLQTKARPATLRVAEYAQITLRLLDNAGPAGWLHKEWVRWNIERPELLERLTQHALELDYLLTPAALSADVKDPNWNKQDEIGKEWKKHAQRNECELQSQLLQLSSTARFPYAWFFKKLLLCEEVPTTQNIPWQVTWDKLLREEMERGKSATYQSCLVLRLLLAKGDEQQLQSIATELQNALSLSDEKQVLALITIVNIHLLAPLYLPHYLHFRFVSLILNRNGFDGWDYILHYRYLLDMRYIRFLFKIRNIHYFRHFLEFHDFSEAFSRPEKYDDIRYLQNLTKLRNILDYKVIMNGLCASLRQRDARSSLILLCIYSIITNNKNILLGCKDELSSSLQKIAGLTQYGQISTLEQRLLIKGIHQVLSESTTDAQASTTQALVTQNADEKAKQIAAFEQLKVLNKDKVEELLASCTDKRETTKETWLQLTGEDKRFVPGSVGEFAWKQLLQPWKMDTNAQEVVVQKLDDNNAIICAAAALILQQSKHLTEHERRVGAQKIMTILLDEDLSRRSLDAPSYETWWLDAVLFETLRVLAE